MKALAVGVAVVLVLVGLGTYGSLSASAGAHSTGYRYLWQAASHVSSRCAQHDNPSSDTYGMIWVRGGRRPLAYAVDDAADVPDVVSSSGERVPLWGVFWPCSTPVAVYGRASSPFTFVTPLASSKAARKTVRLGRA